MNESARTYAAIIAILVLAAGAFFVARHNAKIGDDAAAAAQTSTYSSNTYGFSFAYPSGYVINEYTPQYVTVADPYKTDAADLATLIVRDDSSGSATTLSEFAHAEARATCGSGSGARCTDVTRSESFATARGATGEIFYLKYAASSNATSTDGEAGPFYAFQLPRSATTTILIYPSEPAEGSATHDSGALIAREIVSSLSLQ